MNEESARRSNARGGIVRAALRGTFFLGRLLLRLRYRIHISGLDEVLAKGRSGILILPNHPALIDPPMLLAVIYRFLHPRPLANARQLDRPFIRTLARMLGVFPIPDVGRAGSEGKAVVEEALRSLAARLAAGENVLLYPAGRMLRSREEDLGSNSAVETILRAAPEARVVLVRTAGLWGSRFSWASGREPAAAPILLGGAPRLLACGIFFAPRREVRIDFTEAVDFPRSAGRNAQNAYLEARYREASRPNTYVPRGWWERGGTRVLPEPPAPALAGRADHVPAGVRGSVVTYLANATGSPRISGADLLGRDLGLDSLARVGLIEWLEAEFGVSVADSEALRTVDDVCLAACGFVATSAETPLARIPRSWFTRPSGTPEASIIGGRTIPEAFLARARLEPDRVVLADQSSGVRTYRDLVAAVLVLKPAIERLDGAYIGILMPAGVAATVLYLATSFAGKTPVMINWTVGPRTISHSLALLGIRHVLTARALLDRLRRTGTDLSAVGPVFRHLEDLRGGVSLRVKLLAALRSRVSWRRLRMAPIAETAVVLFTSGSESLPKAVPLTHANVLANLRDVADRLVFREGDRMLGMLPPFHSFGWTGTVVFPLISGMPVVYHSNPTEGGHLARLVEAYGATIMVGTPTFLQGIVRAATGGSLASLRLAFTGAEKCPDALHDVIGRRYPGILVLEGYGITECSPAVAVNDPRRPRRGTIGPLLPSIEHAIVDAETGEAVERGRQGMLLVRGPSVFGGYLAHEGESPFVETQGKTWYRTGDLVTEDGDGVLTFRGRLRRFVKLGGEMISLGAVESVLEASLGTSSDGTSSDGTSSDGPPGFAVEATDDETHPELVLFTTVDVEREVANRALRDAGLSALHNLRRVIRIDEMPLLGTGKTDRRALKAMLGAKEAGEGAK